MMTSVFHVRFSALQDPADTLVLEYVEKHQAVRLEVDVSAIHRIGGSSPIIYCGDTLETLIHSIVSANQGKSLIINPEDNFLYMEVVRVEIDHGKSDFVRLIGVGMSNELYISCDNLRKEVRRV